MPLSVHQAAWLEAHPNHSEEWLRERLADGFDVHHGDGDRSNNDPSNLFLVEHEGHMRLHNLPMKRRLDGWFDAQEARRKEKLELGRKIYELRQAPMTWGDAYVEATGDFDGEEPRYLGPRGTNLARKYAEEAGMPFPPDVGDFKGNQSSYNAPPKPFKFDGFTGEANQLEPYE